MSRALAAAREIDRRVFMRGAESVTELAGGWVIRHRGLPDVYDLNTVWLTEPLAPELGAEGVIALADRWLGDTRHRQLRMDDRDAADRLSAELCDRGWERRRTVLMAMGSERPRPDPDPRAREVSEAEMQALQLASYRESDFGPDASDELPAMLVAAQVALRAGTTSLRFGAGEGGAMQSMCTLFLDPDVGGERVAMVEEVATLEAYRERGLAKAAVSAALLAAEGWEAQQIVIPADADDWPQVFYAGLGFEPAGLVISFTLRSGAVG